MPTETQSGAGRKGFSEYEGYADSLPSLRSTNAPSNEETKIDFGKISDSIAPAPAVTSLAPAGTTSSHSYAGTLDAPTISRSFWIAGGVVLIGLGALMAVAYDWYQTRSAREAAFARSGESINVENGEYVPLTDATEGAAHMTNVGASLPSVHLHSIETEVRSAVPSKADAVRPTEPTVIGKPMALKTATAKSAAIKAAIIKTAAAKPAVVAPAATAQVVERENLSLPASPSREDVQRALLGVRPAVMACSEGRHGTAEIAVSVAPSGRVRSATVNGSFSGSPEGSCMARAVRTASFPEFRKDGFVVTFPYQL